MRRICKLNKVAYPTPIVQVIKLEHIFFSLNKSLITAYIDHTGVHDGANVAHHCTYIQITQAYKLNNYLKKACPLVTIGLVTRVNLSQVLNF